MSNASLHPLTPALKAANKAMQAARAKGDVRGACNADAAFHLALLDGCGNRLLAQAYFMVAGRSGALRSIIIGPHAAIRTRSVTEHERIIETFADGDVLRAEMVLSEHVSSMRENYALAVQANGQAAPRDHGSIQPGRQDS